jgi:hypothetical protein
MTLKTRTAPELTFYGYDPEQAKYTYLPRHSMVYCEKGLGKWTKDFDVFYELYFERNAALKPIQMFIYRHLMSLANRGLTIHLKDYAKHLHLRHNRLIEYLDGLQDAMLLYRICRVDSQGKPNDFVMQTPLTRERWTKEGDEIMRRIQTQSTRLERREMGNNYPGDEYKFSQKKINKAFAGDTSKAEEFTLVVLDLLFQLQAKKWSGRDARKMFEDQLMQGAAKKEIYIDKPKFLAALEIKSRYARTLF